MSIDNYNDWLKYVADNLYNEKRNEKLSKELDSHNDWLNHVANNIKNIRRYE
jgi:galactose-1-phosphate uridylyltransferase